MHAVPTIRIGTRGSTLALAQATLVRDGLDAAGVPAELTIITTDGDRRAPDTPWGEGAFVTAIEASLLAGDIDVAVHSAKDVPTDEDPRLVLAAYLARAPQGDVVVLPAGQSAGSLDALPHGARVGTDSPRRTAFLRAVRPDLALHPLHGNVDTRLRRLDEGQSDALVLAEAGLTRLGRSDRISFRLPSEVVPPAPGQGAIAVQVRADDEVTRAAVARLDDRATRTCVELERAVLAASGGGCRAPVGVAASLETGGMSVLAGFARPDGSLAVLRRLSLPAAAPSMADAVIGDLARAAAAAALERDWPRVLVTRALDQAPALVLALVDRGLAPLVVPGIAIEPARDGLVDALADLGGFDWVVVTSANAARAIRASLSESGGHLPAVGDRDQPRWAAVGPATAAALRAMGVEVSFTPPRSSSRDVAGALPVKPGERVLLPRGDLADDAAVAGLRERGANVHAVVAYRTVEGPATSDGTLRAALEQSPAVVVVTSGSTVRGLLRLADRIGAGGAVRDLPFVAIGPETAAEATDHGLRLVARATRQASAAIADATAGYLRPTEEAP